MSQGTNSSSSATIVTKFCVVLPFLLQKRKSCANAKWELDGGRSTLPNTGHLSGDLPQPHQSCRGAEVDAGQHSICRLDWTPQAGSVVLVQRRRGLLHKLGGRGTQPVADGRGMRNFFQHITHMERRKLQPASPFLLLWGCG